MLKLVTAVFIAVSVSACTWVQVSDEGQGVRVAAEAAVRNCTRVGTTTSTTSTRVLFAERGSERVQSELIVLARNEAGLMGGNTIVSSGTLEAGRQRFTVYNCP